MVQLNGILIGGITCLTRQQITLKSAMKGYGSLFFWYIYFFEKNYACNKNIVNFCDIFRR